MVFKPLIIIGGILLLGSWFLLVERQNFLEKILILVILPLLYIGFRMVTGSTFYQIMRPIQQFFTN